MAAEIKAALHHVELGFDSYTLRGFRWKAAQLIDYAADLGLNLVQFSEWPHLGSYEEVRDDSYLRQVRAHAERRGVRLESGTWVVCPTNPSFRTWEKYGPAEEQLRFSIHIAQLLGSKTVRCVVGSGNLRRQDGPLERHLESTLRVFRNVRDDALRAGVRLAPENHKDMRAAEMRALIEAAGTDFVGATVDTGNPMEVLEDPLRTVETLAPVAVGSHFRDSVLWDHPDGAAFQWTAMGDGSVRIGDVVRRYVELCPGKPLVLEIITGRPPQVLPYKTDPDYWRAFPDLRASEFVEFLKLAERGRPLMAGMIIPNHAPENEVFREAEKEQQRVDLERSVRWLREELKLPR